MGGLCKKTIMVSPSPHSPTLSYPPHSPPPQPPGASAQAAVPAPAPNAPEDVNRVFVGGLPYYLTEEQCKELLGAFGAIKQFDLVKDRETGQSKG